MPTINERPSEEDRSPETAKQRPNQADVPPISPSDQQSVSPRKPLGVTDHLRDIFRRNAAKSSMTDDEKEDPSETLDSPRAQQPVIEPLNDDDPISWSIETSQSPFLPGDPDGKSISTTSEPDEKSYPDQDQNSNLPHDPIVAEDDNLTDETTIAPKGRLKSIFTGVLRNVGVPEPQADDSQEDAIDDRLSDIFSPNKIEPSETSWEEKYLTSLGSKNDSDEETKKSGSSYYDPNEKYYAGTQPNDEEEVDYLFQEWVGFSKTTKNTHESPPALPEIPFNLVEPDPYKSLPAHSSYEEEDEALFEEHNQNFKEKNSFLYNPDPAQSTISLDEMRQVVLEDVQNEHNDPKKRKKRVSVDKSSRSFENLNRIEIIVLVFLGILIIAFVILISWVFAHSTPPAAAVQNTPTVIISDIAPSPVGIRITGGWYFPLTKNTIVDGHWKPQGAEWLEGSDIKRIVTLPWNKQLEAAVRTLVPGDEIDVIFNNNEHIGYQVDKIDQISADKTNSGNETVPSLLILLYDENSPNRWVVTCLPKNN